MPRTCQEEHKTQSQSMQCQSTQYQDALVHVLYSGGAEGVLRGLIMDSIRSIGEDFPTDGVRRALTMLVPHPGASMAHLRVLFFLLLNKDSRMRVRLCQERVAWYLPVLCPHKGCSLYEQLRESVVPAWIRDERVGVLEMEERLRDAYLVA